jgi:hypothetical protein
MTGKDKGQWPFTECGVSFWGDEKNLTLDDGDSCTVFSVCLVSLDGTL